ncbi:four helix bundle protein [Neisseriaceae bacterium TC5R-5]|nr:four helix bundle protein [Neisseriaceae bacterium TC5R-5]
MYSSFEDLNVWKRACQLAVRAYQVLEGCRDFSLKDQMQRAAVSIASNIAEGAERGPKEFAHFLRIARGSAAELRTQAYIAAKIGLIKPADMHEIVEETKQLAKMLFALAKSLKTEN